MSDVRLTINGIDYTLQGVAQEKTVADAVVALQLILLAFVAELQDRGAIDPQMLAHRLKGTFPEDAEDSIVRGLIEVFGRRLESSERPAETAPSSGTDAEGRRSENAGATPFPTMTFQAYSLTDRAGDRATVAD